MSKLSRRYICPGQIRSDHSKTDSVCFNFAFITGILQVDMHQKQIGHQAKAKIKRDYEISHIIAFSMHSRDYVGIIF
jgi:hypothetical protein